MNADDHRRRMAISKVRQGEDLKRLAERQQKQAQKRDEVVTKYALGDLIRAESGFKPKLYSTIAGRPIYGLEDLYNVWVHEDTNHALFESLYRTFLEIVENNEENLEEYRSKPHLQALAERLKYLLYNPPGVPLSKNGVVFIDEMERIDFNPFVGADFGPRGQDEPKFWAGEFAKSEIQDFQNNALDRVRRKMEDDVRRQVQEIQDGQNKERAEKHNAELYLRALQFVLAATEFDISVMSSDLRAVCERAIQQMEE
jgi:hypothetical protein